MDETIKIKKKKKKDIIHKIFVFLKSSHDIVLITVIN